MTLFVADAGFGRGVFSDRPIRRGTLIECAPVIAFPASEVRRPQD